MSATTIKILDKGPLHVIGSIELLDAEGNRFETRGQFTLCRCSKSQNVPFCDGMHRLARFNSCPRVNSLIESSQNESRI
ncbi:CDGSH iron-sulfur domain-containing protein [Bacillus sp. sid0103]|uniref:CDGSH iron-sulfur domain-containing protein n=1 Tax=Bacillus sp. sid0103 TaxID=2856337 RepID=UPI001C4957FF|nr:CDGSH iron-sulfur domain-containing protein [Bacillus sp. sid0103]MBV7508285.1 CDGSH iron-sulfur domain-containing protein [Bacillus sp. sid0103]